MSFAIPAWAAHARDGLSSSRVLSQSCALFPVAHMMVGAGVGEPHNDRFQWQSF
jgi:hypothetical protein